MVVSGLAVGPGTGSHHAGKKEGRNAHGSHEHKLESETDEVMILQPKKEHDAGQPAKLERHTQRAA
jgi:hypothetical protein